MAGAVGAIDLAAALAELPGPYQPSRVGTYNDNKLLVARIQGEFPCTGTRTPTTSSSSSTGG